jgi:hypothetical protein
MIALVRAGALVAVGLILGALVASPFVPYAGMHSGYDVPHEHSRAYADNGQDFSRLTYAVAQPPDSILIICDKSRNGYKAVGRGGNDGGTTYTVQDSNGADDGCGVLYLGFNAGWHDACTGAGRGCGPNSNHGT